MNNNGVYHHLPQAGEKYIYMILQSKVSSILYQEIFHDFGKRVKILRAQVMFSSVFTIKDKGLAKEWKLF